MLSIGCATCCSTATVTPVDRVRGLWENRPVMTKAVEKLADRVKSLGPEELNEFLCWLAEYEIQRMDEWDLEIQGDSQPGGPLEALMKRADADIQAGRTKALDEVIRDS